MFLPPIRTSPSLGSRNDLALAGIEKPRHGPQNRRLATAGRPEKAEELAFLDAQVCVVDRGEIAEADRYVVEFDISAHLSLAPLLGYLPSALSPGPPRSGEDRGQTTGIAVF
jgi:hypothetical protein